MSSQLLLIFISSQGVVEYVSVGLFYGQRNHPLQRDENWKRRQSDGRINSNPRTFLFQITKENKSGTFLFVSSALFYDEMVSASTSGFLETTGAMLKQTGGGGNLGEEEDNKKNPKASSL